MSNRLTIAIDGWPDGVPDWIEALVKACDVKGSSQNKVARRLGLTGAVVSLVISNKYAASTDRVEERVRAVFLDGKIICPAVGELSAESCMNWRDNSHALQSVSPARVRMFNACNACPRNRPDDAEDLV